MEPQSSASVPLRCRCSQVADGDLVMQPPDGGEAKRVACGPPHTHARARARAFVRTHARTRTRTRPFAHTQLRLGKFSCRSRCVKRSGASQSTRACSVSSNAPAILALFSLSLALSLCVAFRSSPFLVTLAPFHAVPYATMRAREAAPSAHNCAVH
eukprot:3203536-Pleurochrysis_carterae.AAC.1